MAAGESVYIECENEELKKFSYFLLNQITDFLHARKSLVEKSVLFGLGIQRKYYKMVDYNGIPVTVIDRMQEVDRRRMRIERDFEDKNDLYWTVWSPKYDQYIILEDRSENPLAPEGAAIQDYVWLVHSREELSPYFEGLGETLYPLAYIKTKAMQYWADLCESWAKPFLVAMIDTAVAAFNGELGSGFVSSTRRVNDLLETFEKARARHCVVVDKSDDVKWMEHGAQGQNIIEHLLQYCDSKIQLNILGAELSTTSTGVGSYALGTVHKKQTDTIVLYNRLRSCEVLTDDVLFDLYYRDRGQMKLLGIDVPRRGDIKLSVKVEIEEIQKKADLASVDTSE
jgi:hypothetical protein